MFGAAVLMIMEEGLFFELLFSLLTLRPFETVAARTKAKTNRQGSVRGMTIKYENSCRGVKEIQEQCHPNLCSHSNFRETAIPAAKISIPLLEIEGIYIIKKRFNISRHKVVLAKPNS